MAILLQSENSFAKYLVWCGVCTDNSDVEYDLTSTDKILQVVEFSANGTQTVYDITVFEIFWDFKKLKVGHAYLITLRKGTGQVEIPNIAVSFSESNAKNKITSSCKPIELTPTPKPIPTPTPTDTPTQTDITTPTPTPTPFDCCSGMNSIVLDNDKDGVSLQMLGDGFEDAQLCYALKDGITSVEPGNSLSFYARTNLGDFIGTISISAKDGVATYKGYDDESSGRFIFKLPSGDCYEGDLEWATPNDYEKGPVFTKVDVESAMEFNEELSFTPTSARYYMFEEETPSPLGSGLNPNIDFGSEDYNSFILSAGSNNYGELASSFDGVRFNPTYISAYSLFSVNENHFIYLLPDGTLWGGGLAKDGQLGDSMRLNTMSSSEDSSEQILDNNLENIRSIITTKQSSFFVRTDNTVWVLGKNQSGEHGTNDEIGFATSIAKQLDIDNVFGFVKPSNAPTSYSNLFLLLNNGDVYGCGYNGNNNLLLGTSNLNYYTPVKLPINNSELVSISLTDTTTLVLKTDGNVYVSGDVGTNGVGGLGLTSESKQLEMTKITNCTDGINQSIFEDVIQIHSNGKDAVVALRADGSVYTWGMGEDILGVGNPNDYTDGFSINDDDDYSARGRKIPTKVDIDDVKYVSMSSNCCFAVKNDGSLWTWGTAFNNENGLGISEVKFTPTMVEFDTFLDVKVESIISASNTNYVKLESS